MKKSTKAVLLSTFVFPGAGHFFLNKKIVGSVLVFSALWSLYVLIGEMVDRALQVAEKIQKGQVPLDVVAIKQLLLKQPAGSEAFLLNIATAALIVSWLIGIVDSYRVGRK